MRRPLALRWIAGAALTAALVAPTAALGATQTWSAPVGEKVFPHTTAPASPAGISLAAGLDEYEGAFAVVRSDEGVTFTPTISDLTGPGVIPAAQVELFKVGYVTLTTRSTGVDSLEGDGRYPDPLIPVAGPVTAPPGETTSILVQVHVPAGAAAGTYTGTLDLGPAGSLPVTVEVSPVRVSRDQYEIVVRFNQIGLARALGVEERDERLVAGVYNQLLPMLRRHGVNPGKAPYSTPKVDPATWAIDYSDPPVHATGTVDRNTNLSNFLAMGFPRVEVPFLPNFPAAGGLDREYRAEGRRRTAAAGFAARFASAVDRTFALIVDEPNPRTYDDLRRGAAQLRSARPNIPVLVTEAPHPEALRAIGDAVDIWAPPIWDFFKVPGGVTRVRRQGKTVWWYTYGSDTQRYTPNVLIDKPSTEPRMLGWLAARENVEGFFYWGLNNWGGQSYSSPWVTPWYKSHTTYRNTCGGGPRVVGGNGEASLIYPTTDPSNPAYGSLRLVGLRDGAEDYSVLKRLESADPKLYRQITRGIATPYTGLSEGGARTGCDDDHRPAYLPVVETDPHAIEGARRAMLARFAGTALPTLRGVVRFAASPKGTRRSKRSTASRAGKPVEAAVVRFGAFSTVTDRRGRWTLRNVSPAAGTLVVSRDPDGRIDPVETEVTDAMLAADGPIVVTTPKVPFRPSRALVAPNGLLRWTGRIRPARATLRGQTLLATVGRRYRKNGDEFRYRGGVAPVVNADYARTTSTRRLRNWKGYRFLEFTAEVLRRPPADQKFNLIVTPGGHYKNARKLAVGSRVQHMRLPLRGMRRMNDVRYLRFGVQSAVPKPWRGGHNLVVRLRVRDLRLVR